MSNDWRFVVADTHGVASSDLIDASERTITFRLTDKTDASWSINGYSPRAAALTELTTDVLVYCNGALMTRLRLGNTSERLNPTEDRITCSAVDYRGLLERRYVLADKTWTATDLASIGWALINDTQQASVNGDFGIRRGTVRTIAPVTYHAPAGKKVSEALDDLAVMYPGMNWWIDGSLRFQAIGFRGIERPEAVMEYGANVTEVQREVDTANYGNAVRFSGADDVAATFATVPDLATRTEGRIEAQEGNPDLTTAANVAASAQQWLINNGSMFPTYTVQLTPGWWTPDALWLGDYARIVIRSGRLDVSSIERVFEIAVTIDDDGGEQVSLTFGNLRADLVRLLRQMPARIEAINRR